MNEKFDFLPLGSIVVVSGGIKKFVIVARALQVNINGCKQLLDRKSTRLNSSHIEESRMPSSA